MSSIDINTVLPIVTVDPTLPEQDEASSVTADHPPSEVGNHTGTFNHADQFSLLCMYFAEKFDKMKHQLKTADPEPKTTKSKFKYKGKSNKIQGRFNEEISEKITQTKTLLESGAMKRGHWKKECPTTRNTGKDLTIKYETLYVDTRERIAIGDASTHMSENVTTDKTPTVKGKLKINLPFWENTLRAHSKILTIMRGGYQVPFLSLPPRHHSKTTYPHTKIKCLWTGRLNNC